MKTGRISAFKAMKQLEDMNIEEGMSIKSLAKQFLEVVRTINQAIQEGYFDDSKKEKTN